MTFEEQTSAFLDRALTPEAEADFLHILSISPEKRELFRSFHAIRAMVQDDIRASSVPSHLDAKVMAGIAALQGAAVSTIATSSAVVAPSLLTRWLRMLAYFLGGAAIFTSGYFLKSSYDAPTENHYSVESKSPFHSPSVTQHAFKDANLHASQAGSSPTLRRIVYKPVQKLVYITDTIWRDSPGITRIDTFFLERPETLVTIVEKEIPVPTNLSSLSASQNSFLENFEIGIEREHLQTYPYIDYGRLNTTRTQQNFSGNITYRFNEHHALGIALGERTFSEEFYRLTNDTLFLVQQQPTYIYGGLFYRLAVPVFRGVIPQAHFQAGATKVGPVLSGKLAVALSPIERIQLLLGAQASMLIYKSNQNTFTSYSLGLFYGVQYRF